jgi:hypothetical protein
MTTSGERRLRSVPTRSLALLAATGLLATGLAGDAESRPPARAEQADFTLVVDCPDGGIPLVSHHTKPGSFILRLACLDPATGQRVVEGVRTRQDAPLGPSQYGVHVTAPSDGRHTPSMGLAFPTGGMESIDAMLTGADPNRVTYEVFEPEAPPAPAPVPSGLEGYDG